ncbi:hypothetical protein [Sciscionella sediminilitoris]|uniref:hypothetical protein n=1 Tax=Sciscionella sediminilitoris TaxID=1445613 RepID=UPI0004DEEA34|nr:hypothetical protein [Sciscionella sp. SE31]
MTEEGVIMFGKKGKRTALRTRIAAIEERTAELITTYRDGDWDLALRKAGELQAAARQLQPAMNPSTSIPRIDICLWHIDSIPLRIAFKRKDIGLIESVAKTGRNLHVLDLASRTVMRLTVHSGEDPDRDELNADEILRESENELGRRSDLESQILHMKNPHPSLIGTLWLPNFYLE